MVENCLNNSFVCQLLLVNFHSYELKKEITIVNTYVDRGGRKRIEYHTNVTSTLPSRYGDERQQSSASHKFKNMLYFLQIFTKVVNYVTH